MMFLLLYIFLKLLELFRMYLISDEKKSFFPATRCPHILPFESVTRHLLLFLVSACASKYFETSLSLLRLEKTN